MNRWIVLVVFHEAWIVNHFETESLTSNAWIIKTESSALCKVSESWSRWKKIQRKMKQYCRKFEETDSFSLNFFPGSFLLQSFTERKKSFEKDFTATTVDDGDVFHQLLSSSVSKSRNESIFYLHLVASFWKLILSVCFLDWARENRQFSLRFAKVFLFFFLLFLTVTFQKTSCCTGNIVFFFLENQLT